MLFRFVLSVHEDVNPRGVNPPLQLLLPLNLTILLPLNLTIVNRRRHRKTKVTTIAIARVIRITQAIITTTGSRVWPVRLRAASRETLKRTIIKKFFFESIIRDRPSNKRGFRHPDVLSGRSAPTTGRCRMKPPSPAVYYTVDGR
jgi:hypothetical protein